MDSRLIFFAVAFFSILVLIRLLRHYTGVWLKNRPLWAIVASSAVLGGLLILARFDTTYLVSCLQGNSLSDCWSPTGIAKSAQ